MASQTAETLQRKLAASVIYIFKTASRKVCRTVKESFVTIARNSGFEYLFCRLLESFTFSWKFFGARLCFSFSKIRIKFSERINPQAGGMLTCATTRFAVVAQTEVVRQRSTYACCHGQCHTGIGRGSWKLIFSYKGFSRKVGFF